LPDAVQGSFFENWRESQQKTLSEINQYFAPVPVRQIPQFRNEVVGYERLLEMAQALYGPGDDPSLSTRSAPPYTFAREDGHYEVRLDLPFAEKAEVGLFKKDDELVVEIGTVRRHIGLPTSMAALSPTKARLNGRMLVIEMKEPE
jgi:arsenite-transporting ATPase